MLSQISLSAVSFLKREISVNDIMKSNEGRPQSAEHILARIVEGKFPDAKFVVAKFEENMGR